MGSHSLMLYKFRGVYLRYVNLMGGLLVAAGMFLILAKAYLITGYLNLLTDARVSDIVGLTAGEVSWLFIGGALMVFGILLAKSDAMVFPVEVDVEDLPKIDFTQKVKERVGKALAKGKRR